jgi:hypothetical protein
VNAQEKVQVYFIGIDTIDKEQREYLSRVIIKSEMPYYHPLEIEIFADSSISNFGVFEIQIYDTLERQFKAYKINTHIDKIQEPNYSTNRAKNQNFRVRLTSFGAFQFGLYRVRITIFFSKYNRDIPDKVSNWSYFYNK